VSELQFQQVDVFTNRPFTGNPLAVFPDAEGLSADDMQMIAREMTAPETTFVVKPQSAEALWRFRIFTPTVELPFTGHPALGALWVMAERGGVTLSEPVTTVVYEQGVGPLTADFFVTNGQLDFIMMAQCQPLYMSVLSDVRPLAQGLGVPPDVILGTGLPAQVVSTGMPQLMVPFRSLAAIQSLDAADMDIPTLTRTLNRVGASFTQVFTTETLDPDAHVHARGFGHLVGIPEDPVTGSACGALGAYLVRHNVVPPKGPTVRITCEQGSEIKRPGYVFVEVDHRDGVATAVRAGGRAVPVLEGVVKY
jgi:trans-2,3-dihydro-3-hydroxyanthranilate isomerase